MSQNHSEVVITGVGPVVPIGFGREAFWAGLAAGRCGVQTRVLPADLGRMVELPVSSMPPADQVPGFERHAAFLAEQGCAANRDLGYTLLAAELALQDAGIAYDRDQNDIGVVQVFEAPGLERTVGHIFELLAMMPPPTDGPPPVYDALATDFYSMQPFLYVHLLGKALGVRGFSTSVHNACSSGAFALEVAAQRVRAGLADVMVVAGGEAFETAVRMEWFRRLELYAHDGCMRPFASKPSGFCVGEGAAAIVVESAAHAARRGAEPYAAYLGGGFAQQGWKQVLPDLRAARLRDVICDALRVAKTPPSELDLIMPHGACTSLSDGYEAACLEDALGGEADRAVATALKPHFGHLLATSGLIEIVVAMLAVKHQTVPATLNAAGEQSVLPVPLVSEAVSRPIEAVLKLSTGFTGHDAASVFRRVE